MTIGFRVREVERRVDQALAQRAAKVPVANIGDVMNRMQSLSGTFHAYGGRKRLVGPAFTVKARSGDNLMLHRAVDMARPGDIIVCDGNGDLSVALMGDLMLGHAVVRGIAGVVIDGAVRDVASLAKMDLGVWARGHTPAGPWKEGPGEIGTPISCGGQVVMPGDLICCDEDGVVVVPLDEAESVIAAAEQHQAKEIKAEEDIRNGRWPRDWVPASLKEKGCEGG
ncbi:RraA family protein [Sabulicella rubraurantiaca]|uniref:RraA family protein n=1 Tax=Sabulicella rubraurantiaca TaxID=2811429 RepID=UPI001A95B83B|nr:RraA family protein [Sabulicella rubraurantiaca]